jgi:hypothetical protein
MQLYHVRSRIAEYLLLEQRTNFQIVSKISFYKASLFALVLIFYFTFLFKSIITLKGRIAFNEAPITSQVRNVQIPNKFFYVLNLYIPYIFYCAVNFFSRKPRVLLCWFHLQCKCFDMTQLLTEWSVELNSCHTVY